jgi:hypothetical protein
MKIANHKKKVSLSGQFDKKDLTLHSNLIQNDINTNKATI